MANPTALILGNPSKRKLKKKGKKMARRKLKKVARRKNPAKRKGMLEKQVLPAIIGGAGAVGAGLAFEYLEEFLPEEMKTGYVKYLAEGGLILAAGMLLDNFKVGDKKMREQLVGGGLTVISYKMLEEFARASDLLPAPVAGYQNIKGYQTVNGGLGWQNTAPIKGRYAATGR